LKIVQSGIDTAAQTRKKGTMATSVKISLMEALKAYPAKTIESATRKYRDNHHDKDEKYWLGICRGQEKEKITVKEIKAKVEGMLQQDFYYPEILEKYQALWGGDRPLPPQGDHLSRVRQAVKAFGVEKCCRAISGHHKLASKDNSKFGRSLVAAFPPISIEGRTDNTTLDSNRFDYFASLAKSVPRVCPEEKEPARMPQTAVRAYAKKGLAQIKEALK